MGKYDKLFQSFVAKQSFCWIIFALVANWGAQLRNRPYDDVTFLDSIGVATARSGLDVGAGSITPIISIQASTDTTTTTSASTIDSFVAATFRSAQYQIQITQGSNYHVTTLNVLHDGSTVFLSEFGTIRTGASLASFDADIDSGNVRVRATPTTDSSTVFKLTKTLTRV